MSAPQYTNPPVQYNSTTPAQGIPQQPQQAIYRTPVPQNGYSSPAQPQYNPQVVAGPGPPRPWENRFFGVCTPMDVCCMSYWCPCVVFGKIHHRLHDPSLTGYKPVNAHCIGWYCAAHVGFAWVLQMLQRSEVRAKYNLKGSTLGDCCRPYWCGCRELMQEEKELSLLAQMQQPLPPQGYQKVEAGMSYAPPQQQGIQKVEGSVDYTPQKK